MFRALDKNADGEVTRAELCEALGSLGVQAGPEEMDDLFSELDPDGSGGIVFRELQLAMINASREPTARRRPSPPRAQAKFPTAVPASSSRPSSRPGSRPASRPGSRPSSRAGSRAASPPVSPEHERAYGYGHSARPAGGGARPRRWQRRRMDSDELLAQARRDRAEIFYISISASCT